MSRRARLCKLLLVENHAGSAKAIARQLSQKGHEVRVAGSYSEAIAAAVRQRFDMLVVDFHLHDGDGCLLLAEIRAMYPVAAVAVTGSGETDERRRAAKAGFDAFLLKPVDVDSLESTLQIVKPMCLAETEPGLKDP